MAAVRISGESYQIAQVWIDSTNKVADTLELFFGLFARLLFQCVYTKQNANSLGINILEKHHGSEISTIVH